MDKMGKYFPIYRKFTATWIWNYFIGKYCFILKNVFSRVATLNITLLAVDRYLALNSTTEYIKWRNSQFFRISPYLSMIISLALSIPIYTWYDIVQKPIYTNTSHIVFNMSFNTYFKQYDNSSLIVYTCNDCIKPLYIFDFGTQYLNNNMHEAKTTPTYERRKHLVWTRGFKFYSYIREIFLTQVTTTILLILTFKVGKSIYKLKGIVDKKILKSRLDQQPSGDDFFNRKYSGIAKMIMKSKMGSKLSVLTAPVVPSTIKDKLRNESRFNRSLFYISRIQIIDQNSEGTLFRIPLVMEEEYWLTVLLLVSVCFHIVGILPISVVNILFTSKLDHLPLIGSNFYTLVSVCNFLELSKACFDSLLYILICPKLKINIPLAWSNINNCSKRLCCQSKPKMYNMRRVNKCTRFKNKIFSSNHVYQQNR
ncbi:unnamed protein product [Gordionus sp. m RMFG-2023]